MSKLGKITRRTFLIGSVAIAGGAAFGYWKYKQPFDNPLLSDLDEGEAALTPYVLINQDGITVIAPRAEMGQGVHTTLAAMVAEELNVSLDQVTIIHGPASKAYYNEAVLEEAVPFAQTDTSSMAENMRSLTKVPAKFFAMQVTGGSSSVPDAYMKMRLAGAAARETLVIAAARKLGVAESELTTNQGYVVNNDGTKLSYIELAVAAAEIEPPAEPTLKPQSEWKILGKSQPRVDMVSKSTGTAEFSIDVDLPNLLYATVKTNPCLGCGMNSYDATEALKKPGVKKVIELENGVAVIATNTWYAFQGANAVKFDWQRANYPENTVGLMQLCEEAITNDQQDSQFRDDGDVDAALQGSEAIEGEYRVPYLAHAPMEPMNATAWVHDGQIEIWAGHQIPTQIIKEAKQITGLDESNIHFHTMLMGGGFGRRLEADFVKQAITIANAMQGTPVKLTWSREEDTTHDFYRPMALARFRAAMNDRGPTAIDLKCAAPSAIASQMGRIGITTGGPDSSIVQAAWDQPYAVENYRVTGYRADTVFPVSSWRSVGASQNAFFHESMMDELAHSKGLDPVAMRLALMSHEPSKQVLESVAELSNWGSALPSGHARGVAFSLSFGVPVAEVVEIALEGESVKIVKVFAAVDVGTALDPRNIEAQVSGGINFGLAAAMMGEITVQGGKVEQTNFHTYNSIRMDQAPAIEVRILENGNRIRGIGEPGLPPVAPALANAIFAATGQRIRELPLNKHVRFI